MKLPWPFRSSSASTSSPESSTSNTSASTDYRKLIQDPDLITYFEAFTPSIRRENIVKYATKIGVSPHAISELAGHRNILLRPLTLREREVEVEKGARMNCRDYKDVLSECANLKDNWRTGKSADQIAKQEDLCSNIKSRYHNCLSSQMKMLYGLGYRISASNSGQDSELRQHASIASYQIFGTPHEPREPTPQEIANIDATPSTETGLYL
ncbi:uncharacterized protein V1518DRAFT_319929 [Limtongia smithiae]|uniref:uncharacterized protein n=1 Tax=Limtongia smithiae TaxID=1125753 RepID=UPI0034CEBE7A